MQNNYVHVKRFIVLCNAVSRARNSFFCGARTETLLQRVIPRIYIFIKNPKAIGLPFSGISSPEYLYLRRYFNIVFCLYQVYHPRQCQLKDFLQCIVTIEFNLRVVLVCIHVYIFVVNV